MYKKTKKYDHLPKFRSIRTKMTLLLSIITIVVVNVVAYKAFSGQLDALFQAETKVYLDEISTRGVDSIQREIHGDIAVLQELAALLETETTRSEKIEEWITQLNGYSLLKDFDKVGIILPNGQGSGQLANEPSFRAKPYFIKALQGQIGISSIQKDEHQHRVIYYFVPILQNEKIIAVLGATINAEALEDILSLPSFEGTGKSYIVENDGKLIIHSGSTDNNHVPNVLATIDQPNKGLDLMKINMRLGKSGELEYSENGVKKNLKYQKIAINDWYLLTIIPNDMTAYKTNIIGTLAMLFSGLVSLILLGFLVYIVFEQNKHKRSLMNLAYVDEVTGALNKSSFKIEAEKLVHSGKNGYAFVLLDIHKFKVINDIFGFAQGDLLLKHIKNVLAEDVGKNEVFARIDGDKFYILMEYMNEENIIIRLEQIMENISTFQFSADSIYKTVACAGIYLIEDVNMSIDSMSDRANLASRKTKGHHQNTYFFYNDEMRNQLIEEQQIENEMHRALEQNEFQIYLQPKYDIRTEKIAGAEALVRWLHPEKGLIPPGRFVPLFEKDGFVTKMDMFMLDEVCKKQRQWIDQGNESITISVNQSKLHLYNRNYLQDLKMIIEKYQINPNYIELELTESAVFDNVDILIDATNKLHEMGFKLSIDDFGTGYSSLNMLKDIVLDTLKLDGAFFEETADLVRSQKITEHIIKMSKDLGMTIVAEGVETKEQVEFLRTIGCDLVQGFYYAKPMPLDVFFDILSEENKKS